MKLDAKVTSILIAAAFLVAALIESAPLPAVTAYSSPTAPKTIFFLPRKGNVGNNSSAFGSDWEKGSDAFSEVPTDGLPLGNLLAQAIGLNQTASSFLINMLFRMASRIDFVFGFDHFKGFAVSFYRKLGYSLAWEAPSPREDLGAIFPGNFAFLRYLPAKSRAYLSFRAVTIEEFARFIARGEMPSAAARADGQFSFRDLDLSHFPALHPALGMPGLYGSGGAAGMAQYSKGALSFIYPTRFGLRSGFCLNSGSYFQCSNDPADFSPPQRKLLLALRKEIEPAHEATATEPPFRLMTLLEKIREGSAAVGLAANPLSLEEKSLLAFEMLEKCARAGMAAKELSFLRQLVLQNDLFYWSFDTTLPASVLACGKAAGDDELTSYGNFLASKSKFERGTFLSSEDFLNALAGIGGTWPAGDYRPNWHSDVTFLLARDRKARMHRWARSIPGISAAESPSHRAVEILALAMQIRARHLYSSASIELSGQLIQKPGFLTETERTWIESKMKRFR